MLEFKDTVHGLSTWRCDMCNNQIFIDDKVCIHKEIGRAHRTKEWDLCKKCFFKLRKAIAKQYKEATK